MEAVAIAINLLALTITFSVMITHFKAKKQESN